MKRLLVFVAPAVFGLSACVVEPVRSEPPAYIPPPPPRYVPPNTYVPPPPPPAYAPPPPDAYAPPPDNGAYSQDPAYAPADAQTAAALTGKADLTQVATAVTQAELALQTTNAIRDKVVQAYQDIMRMTI